MVNNCVRCSQEISEVRRSGSLVICDSCGYLHRIESPVQKNTEQLVILLVAAISLLALTALAQLAKWDRFALEADALIAKEVVGVADHEDIARMADICFERRNFNCTKAEYGKLIGSDPQFLIRLGHLHMGLAEYPEAAETFRAYFAGGGKDVNAAILYADSLNRIGKTDESLKFYEYALRSAPDRIQITVEHEYINALIRLGRFNEASSQILQVRAKEGGSSFMSEEMKSFSRLPAGRKGSS